MTLAGTRERMRAWAERRRPQITLKEGSLPHVIYLYWRRRSKSKVVRENFCHLMRVLVFWVPMFVLRDVFTFGPKAGKVVVPVVPTSMFLGSLGIAYYLWADTFLNVVMWTGVVAWCIMALFAIIAWIIFSKMVYDGFSMDRAWDRLTETKAGRVVVISLSILTLPALIAGAIAAGVLILAGGLVVGALYLLFEKWEIHKPVGAGLKWFFVKLHVPGLDWLTPAWLVLVPIGWVIYELTLARWIAGIVVAVIAAFIAWDPVKKYVVEHHIKPAREAAERDRKLRERLALQARRERWRLLVSYEPFQTWFWESDDVFAISLRETATIRGADLQSPPLVFIATIGDENMAAAENMFLLWRTGATEYDWHTEVRMPPAPNPVGALLKKVAKPFVLVGQGLWWLIRGIAQVFMVVFTAVWSAKVVGICPLVEFEPTDADTDTDAEVEAKTEAQTTT
jgi:hypothetical protein